MDDALRIMWLISKGLEPDVAERVMEVVAERVCFVERYVHHLADTRANTVVYSPLWGVSVVPPSYAGEAWLWRYEVVRLLRRDVVYSHWNEHFELPVPVTGDTHDQ